ncbi:Non-reducing end alpha-L-arabinofuranosidase BoGH43A [Penicillium subrubescens]|uniref:Non-reducing end alpha-L-arabinofuranosidase BoGH43A n=2 Tax=Penicillium subrubescens TaxID=1316194 RepID=A0A1Q5U4N7_9EURO|nr:Non-reducing end alpha-L-arabinofuranosidase BoGH43A [Penicillium subrubescens]
MVHSSFHFFPGLPIHKSKDLINWEHIGTSILVIQQNEKLTRDPGNVICRPEQIRLYWATTKINNAAKNEVFTGGLYAPTIRYNDGRFYVVCTSLKGTINMPPDLDFAPENFIITATDLEDPTSFSDPVYFDFHGIDPSLFFDEDGRVYLQGSWIHGYRKTPATVIRQAEIDLSTGQLLSPASDIWSGHTGKVPEGPHIYKKDGYYYLLIAEGGTHRGHKITMSRSKSIWGPFESFEGNPVLTADATQACIQCAGHAELFQDALGYWWAVMLARREYGASFPLGRETYLTPVEWPEGEFPNFAPVKLEQELNRPVAEKVVQTSFTPVSLDSPSTIYLRSPDLDHYAQSGIAVFLTPTKSKLEAPSGTMTFVGQRQTSLNSIAQAILPVNDIVTGNIYYGLTVYKDPFRFVAMEYSNQDRCLCVKVQETGKPMMTLSCLAIRETSSLQLSIESSTQSYSFQCLQTHKSGKTEHFKLGEVPSSALSGDDFTGTVYAIYASGDGAPVKFENFQIRN